MQVLLKELHMNNGVFAKRLGVEDLGYDQKGVRVS